ncbi:unnamed protein product, partial [Lampetra planeri]
MSRLCAVEESPHALGCAPPPPPPTIMSSAPCVTEDILEELQVAAAQSLELVDAAEHYDIIRELGKGTYGKVDLAVHKGSGTKMALKFLKKKSTKLKAFLREYSITNYLSTNPFIINIFNVTMETEDAYIFAQEYAPAGDLFDIIPPQVGLPEGTVKRCIQQVGLALDFLHGRGLVHRDVKPENVLLFDRECRRVKLSDFGMTRRAGARVKRVSGTIPYTAPELCDGARSDGFCVRPSIDVWAFAVLLFCMLTGNFPWETATPGDPFYGEFLSWQRRKAAATAAAGTGAASSGAVPSQWRRFSPDALRLFRRLLATDPCRRCAVAELFRYLTGSATSRHLTAPPPPPRPIPAVVVAAHVAATSPRATAPSRRQQRVPTVCATSHRLTAPLCPPVPPPPCAPCASRTHSRPPRGKAEGEAEGEEEGEEHGRPIAATARVARTSQQSRSVC